MSMLIRTMNSGEFNQRFWLVIVEFWVRQPEDLDIRMWLMGGEL